MSDLKGGLSVDKYLSLTGTYRATATRDLRQLVEWDTLKRVGERRHPRYYLNL